MGDRGGLGSRPDRQADALQHRASVHARPEQIRQAWLYCADGLAHALPERWLALLQVILADVAEDQAIRRLTGRRP